MKRLKGFHADNQLDILQVLNWGVQCMPLDSRRSSFIPDQSLEYANKTSALPSERIKTRNFPWSFVLGFRKTCTYIHYSYTYACMSIHEERLFCIHGAHQRDPPTDERSEKWSELDLFRLSAKPFELSSVKISVDTASISLHVRMRGTLKRMKRMNATRAR